MRRTPIKNKPQKRSKAQQKYFDSHQKCEVCSRPACDVHHINQRREDDIPENFFSLCMLHHRLGRGVHHLGVVVFCEWMRLTEHPKWKEVYDRAKRSLDYIQQIKDLEAEAD